MESETTGSDTTPKLPRIAVQSPCNCGCVETRSTLATLVKSVGRLTDLVQGARDTLADILERANDGEDMGATPRLGKGADDEDDDLQ